MWDLKTIIHMNSEEEYEKIRKRALAMNRGTTPEWGKKVDKIRPRPPDSEDSDYRMRESDADYPDAE